MAHHSLGRVVVAVLFLIAANGCSGTNGRASADPSAPLETPTDPNPGPNAMSDDLVTALSDEELIGNWALIDAEPPAGTAKPTTNKHSQSLTFHWDSRGDKLFMISELGCERSAVSFIGLGTPNPAYGDDASYAGYVCGSDEADTGIWSDGVFPDPASFSVDGDTMTATNGEGWHFTFERDNRPIRAVPDDLVAVLTNPDLIGHWNLIDAEPPAGIEKPTDMLRHSLNFQWSPDGRFFADSFWNCTSSRGQYLGMMTASPTDGRADEEGEACGEPWSWRVYPDRASFSVDGDTMTASNGDGWFFTFERRAEPLVPAPADLVAVLADHDIIGPWHLIDAEPPAGVDKPTDMHNHSLSFQWESPDDQFVAVIDWGCERATSLFLGLTTANPAYGGGGGYRSDNCAGIDLGVGIWSSDTPPDFASMRVDGDTMTAASDDGWLFTFERQPHA